MTRVMLAPVAALMLGLPTASYAGCMPAPTRALQALADMASSDPAKVLAQTPSTPGNGIEAAWTAAARAEALDVLSRPAEARQAASDAMRRVPDQNAPVYAELLMRRALNTFRRQDVEQDMGVVNAAMKRQRRGSAAEICLRVALGEMYRVTGRPDGAIINLTQAYSASSSRGLNQPRIVAAEKLSRVMGWSGDIDQAISLIDEVADWDRRHDRRYALANDLYFHGMFQLQRGSYQAAIADFEQSRAIAPPADDPSGNAYLDLQLCRAFIELGRLQSASGLCQRAKTVFRKLGDDTQSQADLMLARVAFGQGRTREALTILDRLLAADRPLSASVKRDDAYRVRAQVNSKLGDSRAAYHDLATYLNLTEQKERVDRDKQLVVQRARFAANRETARNRELQRDLKFSQERERERHRRDSIYLFAGVALLLLLSIIAVMALLHRRRLTRLADSDVLTGVMNRRAITRQAMALVASHSRGGWPMAIAIVDLDHFKAINDRLGHDVGDKVLVRFAEMAVATLRTQDLVARWGGEEFLLLFPRTTLPEAASALDRLRLALKMDDGMGDDVRVSFSAGICAFTADKSFEALVIVADRALYQAKRDGRDRIVAASTDLIAIEPHRPAALLHRRSTAA